MLTPDQLKTSLPEHYGKAFELLSGGKHISSADGDVFYDLQARFETYEMLFAVLGFKLHKNARGYFYFHREGLAQTIEQIAVFTWILVDWMADAGRSITAEILVSNFETSELPHLKSDRYRSYADKARFGNDLALKGVLKHMRRLGFLRSHDDLETFNFLPPIFRIMDATQAVLRVSEVADGQQGAAAGGAVADQTGEHDE